MPDSPNLILPYLAAAQAQKHVTHNEALSLLDGLVQLAVASRATATPPPTPFDGVRYLVPAGSTGEWATNIGKIALRMEGAWRYVTPVEGFALWVSDEDKFLAFNGTVWIDLTAGGGGGTPTTLPLLGINTTADATNKFTVASSALLLNNIGYGVQVKLNKNVAADTASLLFQTGFSGRAEMGTAGDDDFHFKVSADGTTFREAIVVQAATGRVTLKNAPVIDPAAADPATPVNGQLWYNSTTSKFRVQEAGIVRDVFATDPNTQGPIAARFLVMS
jgi:Protein of unknown function (DUF2793)